MLTTTIPEPDPQTLSPSMAGEILLARATQMEREGIGDYSKCMELAKQMWPALAARMRQGTEGTRSALLAMGNETEIPPEPVFSPSQKLLLGLPSDATQEECSMAWQATKGILGPRNTTAIWHALVALIKKQRKDSDAEAVRYARARYPLLAQEIYPGQPIPVTTVLSSR